jgi:hypothetical protein
MTAITRLGGDKLGPEKSGPEQYAPPDWRARENLRDVDQTAANAFEGEIREFLRRDVSLRHQQQSNADPANEPAVENLNELIRRIASASIEEIDRAILELQGVRDMLRNEGERLGHEIARYTTLSQASMTAMKAIGDSLKQSKGAPKRGLD